MLANVTRDPTILTEAVWPLAYTLPSVALYQADSGYRAAVPTAMQMSCIRGYYSAAFETHNTIFYLHRILELSASLPPELRLPGRKLFQSDAHV